MTNEQREKCLKCDFKVNNPDAPDPSWCYQFRHFDRDECDLFKPLENDLDAEPSITDLLPEWLETVSKIKL